MISKGAKVPCVLKYTGLLPWSLARPTTTPAIFLNASVPPSAPSSLAPI
jgi:hypothetical protein